MSKPTPPKPGAKLKALQDRIEKVRDGYEAASLGGSADSEALLECLLGDLEKEALNPDDAKYMMGRFAEMAENAQERADQFTHLAYMMAVTADKVQAQFARRMKTLSIQDCPGETFTAHLKPLQPGIRINPKEVPPDYLKEIKVPDEEKIFKTVMAGFDIRGVEKIQEYEIDFTVNKKVK